MSYSFTGPSSAPVYTKFTNAIKSRICPFIFLRLKIEFRAEGLI